MHLAVELASSNKFVNYAGYRVSALSNAEPSCEIGLGGMWNFLALGRCLINVIDTANGTNSLRGCAHQDVSLILAPDIVDQSRHKVGINRLYKAIEWVCRSRGVYTAVDSHPRRLSDPVESARFYLTSACQHNCRYWTCYRSRNR